MTSSHPGEAAPGEAAAGSATPSAAAPSEAPGDEAPRVVDSHLSPREGARRALYALLASVLPFTLWHHAIYRRGGAYLLLDRGAPARWVALVHVASAVAGVALALRWRRQPPWRPPALLLSFACGCALALVGAFFAFASGGAFVAFAFGAAAALGALGGALAASLARGLSALSFPRSAVLDLLRVEPLGAALVLAVGYLLSAERLGPLRTGLLLSLLCALVAHLGVTLVAARAPEARRLRRVAAGACYALALAQLAVEPLTPLREVTQVPDPVVLAVNAPANRLVLTSGRGAFQLYADGLLRTSSIDAARRREATAHPVMLAAPRRARVLLLGGGDGGALREILRYPGVEAVTLVEPEPSLLDAARDQPALRHEHGGALSSPLVRSLRADPTGFLASDPGRYDVIVVDLLEAQHPRRAKWYTRHFYARLAEHLADDGVGVVAAGASPLGQRKAFWCVVATLEAAGLHALPYRAQLPTLGPWGYVLVARRPLAPPSGSGLPAGLLALDAPTLASLFALAPDEQRVETEVNLLHHQVLPRYRALEP